MIDMIAVATYIPDNSADLQNDYQQIGTPLATRLGVSKLQAKIFMHYFGLRYIPIALTETLEHLLVMSLTRVLQASKIAYNKIDYVIYAHTSLTLAPFGNNILQQVMTQCAMSKARYFGFNLNKCAAALEALRVISRLFAADNQVQYIVLLTGDKIFTTQQRVLQNASIAGDAAGAAIFTRASYPPSHHLSCQSVKLRLIAVTKHVYDEFYRGAWLTSAEAHKFTKKFPALMASVIKAALLSAAITLAAIKYILPHNVNLPVWRAIATELNISFDKIYVHNIALYAHCFTTDFFINCHAVMPLLQLNDYIVAANVGFGLNIVVAIFQKK